MRHLFLLLTFLTTLPAYGQVGPFDQSPASTRWETLANDFVEVIYPDYLKPKAIYVANLVEHYSHSVGATFGIKRPEKIALIIRADMAEPNGFVTLAPRRTEWYSSATYSPIVGSLDWYQALSIHEYRHVQQFDFFQSDVMRILNILFGDTGRQLGMAISLLPWYFEGDAVWAETKYTDAGRGRLPRFLARLKGVLLAGDVPTYDQFVNGTYTTNLPNMYVYGYILVSRARQKFGDDFWTKVEAQTAAFPHPFRLYSAFADVSGQEFSDFYDETFADLKKAWAKDSEPRQPAVEYRVELHPHRDQGQLYFVRTDLDHHPGIYRRGSGQDVLVKEIRFISELTPVDMAHGKAIYNEYDSDERYGFQGYSNIVLVDLHTSAATTVVRRRRLYAPHLAKGGDRFVAVEFTPQHIWRVVEFNLDGSERRAVALPQQDLVEATYLGDDRLAAIALDLAGRRSLIALDLNTGKATTLLPPSRNTLTSLSDDHHGGVLFEADYQGYTDIFKVDARTAAVAKCTNSKIGAYTPSADGDDLWYADEDPYGRAVKKMAASQCKSLPAEDLVAFHYLGKNPSDNYNGLTPVAFPEQESLHTKNATEYTSESYSGFDRRAFTPHSWGFLGGRGFALSAQTNNYLRDFSSDILIGQSAEENANYAALVVSYSRYYPIFSLLGAGRARKVDFANDAGTMKWREYEAGLGITLPYIKDFSNFHGAAFVQDQLERLATSQYTGQVEGARPSLFVKNAVTIGGSIKQDLTYRSIKTPLGLTLAVTREDATSALDHHLSSQRTYGLLALNTPSPFAHHGFEFDVVSEENTNSLAAYRFTPINNNPEAYAFSRGYKYFAVDRYTKESINYYFPLAYPDFNLMGCWYLKRLWGNLYYDQTQVMATAANQVLRSAGAELTFQSVFFRFLPIDFGARYVHRYSDRHNKGEFYLATKIGTPSPTPTP